MEQNTILTVLNKLKEILLKEKDALIQNEGHLIQELVSKKEELACQLEQLETEKIAPEEIRPLVGEIRELQETNALLTQQAINYTSVFLSAFQKETQKKATYSKEGTFEKMKNSTLLDQSL